MAKETVLITGGNGFLGQHLIKEIQERDENVAEIRVLDKTRFSKRLDYTCNKVLRVYECDLLNIEDCRPAFTGVDCVFHCAALVCYRYSTETSSLYDQNVTATENVIELCRTENVDRLVFTSTSEVTHQGYFGSFFSIIINQTEVKALAPLTTDKLTIRGYPETKLKAEAAVLRANDKKLSNGLKTLRTLVLRPTILYGEGDCGLLSSAVRLPYILRQNLYLLGDSQSRQQLTYVGNAAWGHIKAKDALLEDKKKVSGKTVFLTDDTPIQNSLNFVELLRGSNMNIGYNWLPCFVVYLISKLVELLFNYLLEPIFKISLPFSVQSLVSYLCSYVYFNRLRAALCLDYIPIYDYKEAFGKSALYYKNKCNSAKI